MDIIKGTTVEEQLTSVDAALRRLTRKTPIFKTSSAHSVGISGYIPLALAESLSHDIAPCEGEIDRVVIIVNNITKLTSDAGVAKVNLSISYEEAPDLWYTLTARLHEGRNETKLNGKPIKFGARFELTFDRDVAGVWYAVEIKPTERVQLGI